MEDCGFPGSPSDYPCLGYPLWQAFKSTKSDLLLKQWPWSPGAANWELLIYSDYSDPSSKKSQRGIQTCLAELHTCIHMHSMLHWETLTYNLKKRNTTLCIMNFSQFEPNDTQVKETCPLLLCKRTKAKAGSLLHPNHYTKNHQQQYE